MKTAIYIAKWNGREYAYALSYEKAKSTVINHFAFGKAGDGYALGDHWAANPDDSGWLIEKHYTNVVVVPAEEQGGTNETCHVTWQCPFCGTHYSEDQQDIDQSGLLVVCDCKNKKKYMVAKLEGEKGTEREKKAEPGERKRG